MTDQEKQRVLSMRKLGRSYGTIAKELKVSINTVRTFCRRAVQKGTLPASPKPEAEKPIIDNTPVRRRMPGLTIVLEYADERSWQV